jgi:hypothetical protein
LIQFLEKNKKFIFLMFFLIAFFVFSFQLIKNFSTKEINFFHYTGGDGYSQLNAYTAGLNFAKHGFQKLYFLPIISEYKSNYKDLKKEDFYTHYPAGPDIVSSFLSSLGILKYYSQKKILLIVSFLALFFYILILQKILNYKYQEIIFLSLILSSPYFVFFSGNLHEFSYWDLFIGIGIYSLLIDKKIVFFITCFFSLFFTFEIAPFLFSMAIFKSIIDYFDKKITITKSLYFLLITFFCFLFSFSLHVFQNIMFFGSFKLAYNDLFNSLTYRLGQENINAIYEYSFVKHCIKIAMSFIWYYGISIFVLGSIGIVSVIKNKDKNKILWTFGIFISSFAWIFTFRQHSMIHVFTNRHYGLAIIIFSVIGFFELLKNKKKYISILAIILLLVSILRLPLGCEFSNNKFLLNKFEKVIKKTDSVTLAEVLFQIKKTQEHKEEKKIILFELLKRNNIQSDKEIYFFDVNNKKFYLKKSNTYSDVRNRKIPLEIENNFSKGSDYFFDEYNLENSMNIDKNEIKINGQYNKIKEKILFFYINLV